MPTRITILLVTLALGGLGCGVKLHPHPPLTGQGGSDEPPLGPGDGIGGSAGSGVPSGTGGRNSVPGAGGGTAGNTGTGGSSSPGTDASSAGGGPGGGAGGMAGSGGEPPASGNGIMIGGRFFPQEKAIVFIHVGHSDMAGRADGPADLRPFMFDTNPQLFVYAKGGAFRLAKEPTAGDAASAGKSGPGMAILKTALAKAQSPDLAFISIGHGHSGAQMGYCANFRRGRLIWPLFMDAAKELKGKVTFGALFTMFGITEYRGGPSSLSSTGDCILGLLNDIRDELGVPELPLMVGGWNEGGTDIYSPNGENGRIVKPQLDMLPSREARAGLIPTNGLPMQDDRHLNMAGQKLWAERAFMIMEEKGFLPWRMR